MDSKIALIFGFALFATGIAPLAWSEGDADGCKDHPLFNRMPGYRINSCEAKQFDARDFPAGGALKMPPRPPVVL